MILVQSNVDVIRERIAALQGLLLQLDSLLLRFKGGTIENELGISTTLTSAQLANLLGKLNTIVSLVKTDSTNLDA